MPARDAQVADRLAARELGALVVSGSANLRWLTGFTGSSGLATVGPGKARHFFTDFRYDEQSAAQLGKGWERHIVADLHRASGELLHELQSGRPLRVGFDDRDITIATHRTLVEAAGDGVELAAAGGIVEDLRTVKDDEEIAAIRASAALADAALLAVLERGLAGRTEREVATDLEIEMRRAGAQAIAFPPIVASGAHGALPHAEPRDVKIPGGVLVTIDWGAELDGYCSDCTRTFATGDVRDEERAVYDLVLEAQEASLAAVRPGPTGREVDAVARDIIEAAGHGEHFGHGLGHGVGLEVHEGPRLSRTGEQALAPGMIVTVEPGVYLPGSCGVRIEDLVLVTEAGPEVLNTLPKQLQIVA